MKKTGRKCLLSFERRMEKKKGKGSPLWANCENLKERCIIGLASVVVNIACAVSFQ